MNQLSHKLCLALGVLSTQAAFSAANFNITLMDTLPTTVAPGQTVLATFILTNMTHTTRTGYTIQGLPTGVVSQNTSTPNCSNPINLAPKASCQLQFNITGAVNSSFAICKDNSCTTSPYPLNVSVNNNPPKVSTRAYITQYVSSPTLAGQNKPVITCSINQTDGSLENCQSANADNTLGNIQPQGIAINNTNNTAYMTDVNYQSPKAYQCAIDNTGLLNNCSASTITAPAGYAPYYGLLTLNSNSTLAYLVDYYGSEGRVLSCPINNDILQENCTNTGATVTDYAIGIVLNANNTIAYLGNYDYSYLTTCTVSNGLFTNCGNKTGDGNLSFSSSGPTGVALNNTGTVLYTTDYGTGTIYGCDTTTATSATAFNSCFIAKQGLSDAWSIALNASNTFAYVTDYTSTVYVCAIKADNTFGTCTANNNFISPVSIALM